MNTAETVVSFVLGTLSLILYSYAMFRYAYGKGFDRAMELVDEMEQKKRQEAETT